MIKTRLSGKAQSLRDKKHSLAQEMKAQLLQIKQQQKEFEHAQLQEKLKKYQAFQESEQAYQSLKLQREQRLQRKLSKSHSSQTVPTSYTNQFAPRKADLPPTSPSSLSKLPPTLSERKKSLPGLLLPPAEAPPVNKRKLYYLETVKALHKPTASVKKQLELKLLLEKMNENKRKRKAIAKVFLNQIS